MRTRAARGAGESRLLCPACWRRSEIELAGAAVGAVPEGCAPRSSARIPAPGDEIVLVGSSGLHANGASLARLIAGRLSGRLRDGALRRNTSFGEALLEPSIDVRGARSWLLLLAQDAADLLPQPHNRDTACSS